MLEHLHQALPPLHSALAEQPLLNDPARLWVPLRRLLLAHAPSGGAALPGGVLDDIASLVAEFGLADRFMPRIGSTGNAAVWLGVDKPAADLIVVAHMDRPSFRVRSTDDGLLVPICANRFPDGRYDTPARALRFEEGRLGVGASGTLVSVRGGGRDIIRMRVESGALRWYDTITLAAEPMLDDGWITGTGLDNSLGVLVMCGAAAVLKACEDTLREHDRRCLFVFTDQEEGPPEAFFGHGAARLTHALPPPTLGVIISDAHAPGGDSPLVMGGGAGHGVMSAWGGGSVVPPNWVALAVDLAGALNAETAGTVQLNTGYLSRSDDMALGRWAPILGMIGVPVTDAHTGHERAALADAGGAVRWLTHFLAAALALAPKISQRYVLLR